MALTMTRARTQTALTKLATRLANLNGELAFVEGRLADAPVTDDLRVGLERRRAELLSAQEALFTTLRQFDPRLDPSSIGRLDDWLRPFGRGRAAAKRYEAGMAQLVPTRPPAEPEVSNASPPVMVGWPGTR